MSTAVQNVKLGNGLTFRVNLKLDFVSNWNNEIIYFEPHRKKSLSLNLLLLYSRFLMEEDTKGIRKENFALSLNIRVVQ